ncbi:MAG: hypothetical protein GX590_09880 [Lentisphaerae bacterium]|nr:hypothetical protein [Lentisphaerota bacterium]
MTLRDHHGSATLAYLDRLYDPSRRMHAFDGTTRQAHEAWSAAARPALMRLLGLEQLEAERDGFVPSVALGEAEPQEGYTRSKGLLLAEPDVSVPFWMLVPGGRVRFRWPSCRTVTTRSTGSITRWASPIRWRCGSGSRRRIATWLCRRCAVGSSRWRPPAGDSRPSPCRI